MEPEFSPCLYSSRSAIPAKEHCVLRHVLAKQARDRGGQVFAVFENGTEWTFANTLDHVERTAAALALRGVSAGDRVLVWLPNGEDCLRLWFAINWLGAVYVPINIALKGAGLEHVINNSGARLLISISALTSRLSELSLAKVDRVVIISGDIQCCLNKTKVEKETLLDVKQNLPANMLDIEPWDEQTILFTSGTTGPSKGVLSSYCHLATSAAASFEERLHTNIRYLVQLPMFHVGATAGIYAMLLCGGSIAVISNFNTNTFWETVRSLNVTCATILGTMASYLLKMPPSTKDKTSGLKWCYVVPLIGENKTFSERFSVEVLTQYNMTELSTPIITGTKLLVPDSCGRVRKGVNVQIVNTHDEPLPAGEVGELCVRTERPWAISHGYNQMPEATAAAWRNGWFHTGDSARYDDEGNYYFVDRLKDAIRRRGENISSLEVESELLSYPDVLEAAVVGVPSDDGEEDVMAAIVPTANGNIDPIALIEFLRPRLAHFMIPRYLLIQKSLPKTQTGKVQKGELRKAEMLRIAWDREAYGIRIKRDELPQAQ